MRGSAGESSKMRAVFVLRKLMQLIWKFRRMVARVAIGVARNERKLVAPERKTRSMA